MRLNLLINVQLTRAHYYWIMTMLLSIIEGKTSFVLVIGLVWFVKLFWYLINSTSQILLRQPRIVAGSLDHNSSKISNCYLGLLAAGWFVIQVSYLANALYRLIHSLWWNFNAAEPGSDYPFQERNVNNTEKLCHDDKRGWNNGFISFSWTSSYMVSGHSYWL